MVRILIIVLVIFIAYKLFSTDFQKKREANEKEQKAEYDKKAASGELVKDPVCGAYVSVEDSIRVRNAEQIHYFCSYECRDAFLKQVAHTRALSGDEQQQSNEPKD